MVICLRMGKIYLAKISPSDFKVTTPENLLLSQQVVTSKGILVSYTNLQLNSVRVLFSLAHRPKDPGPNSCILVDWAWFTAAKYGLITNQVVHKSHKSPQGKNAIPPKQ